MGWLEKMDVAHLHVSCKSFKKIKIVDDYNNGMNTVDQADQLCNVYQFDLWMRTRKWWWAIWLWGVQVCII
jgi:hypothetical protein